jgi:8-oxo-dGTP pyrophosphatase MutT (NUDIX family)
MTEASAWRVLASNVLVDRPPWLRVIEQRVELPNGIVIEDYLLTPTREYAMTVAVTPAREVLVVSQYKHGIGRAIVEFPAGYIDASDADPLACAKRELLEETGFTSDSWLSLGAFCLDPNRGPAPAHFFLAQNVRFTEAPALDDTEALTTTLAPLAEVPAMVSSGAMPSMACAAAWALALPYLE